MKSSSSYTIASSLAVLLVGDQKTGKTNVAMAFPDPYFLNVDRNLDSAVRVAGDKRFFYDDPTVEEINGKEVRVEDHLVYPRAMELLKRAAISPEVRTLVIDSASTLSLFMASHVLAEVSRMEGKKVERLRIQDYGSILSLFQRHITMLRSSGKIVIVTSHQTYDKDEMTGALNYTLAIPGQMKFNFGAFFTDVWGMTAEPGPQGKTDYRIRTRPTGRHVALGTSVRTMPADIKITDLTPSEVWSKHLSPMLGIK